jgi:hypothetical protein
MLQTPNALKCFYSVATLALLAILAFAKAAVADDSGVVAAAQMLARFQSSHAMADLSSAVDKMYIAPDFNGLTPQNFTAQRRIIVAGWANIIKAIDGQYDATFDPKMPPLPCPMPPQAAGASLMPCSDPSLISDPTARAAYAKEMTAYQRFNVQVAHYWAVRKIDESAMTDLEMTLGLFRQLAPKGTPSDFTALDGILQQTGLSSSRRAAIDAMIKPHPGN